MLKQSFYIKPIIILYQFFDIKIFGVMYLYNFIVYFIVDVLCNILTALKQILNKIFLLKEFLYETN